jgi:hypothetical protein
MFRQHYNAIVLLKRYINFSVLHFAEPATVYPLIEKL